MGTWIMARLTFREAVRRRIAVTAALLGLGFLVIFNLGVMFIIKDVQSSPFRDLLANTETYNMLAMAGLYAVNFLMVMMAALVTADTLAGEIASGAIQSIVSKPLRRAEVVLGKWLGYAGLIFIYAVLLEGGVVASVALQTGFTVRNVALGLGLIYLEGLVVMTLALAFSSSLTTLATGGAVFGMYGLAFVGGWVEQIGSYMNSPAAVQIGIVSSLLLPSEALWRRASHLMASPLMQYFGDNPFVSRSVPSDAMVIYAGVYLLVVLLIAVRRFSKRDL